MAKRDLDPVVRLKNMAGHDSDQLDYRSTEEDQDNSTHLLRSVLGVGEDFPPAFLNGLQVTMHVGLVNQIAGLGGHLVEYGQMLLALLQE